MSDYLLFLGNLMRHLNAALEDEGVDPGVRQRVVNRLLLGTPEPDTARPKALAANDDWPAFGDLKPGAVFVTMDDDSNSGPGWPLAQIEAEAATEPVNPPMNAGGF